MEVVAVATDDGQPFSDVQQVFQVSYHSKPTLEAQTKVEKVHYGLTCLSPERASSCRLLTLHQRHWAVESRSRFSRDMSLLEDDSHIRTGLGPADNAALALIKHNGKDGAKFKMIGEGVAYALYRESRAGAGRAGGAVVKTRGRRLARPRESGKDLLGKGVGVFTGRSRRVSRG